MDGTRHPVHAAQFVDHLAAIHTFDVTTASLPAPAGAEVVEVVSAADMQAAVMPIAADHDVIVMAAAVADGADCVSRATARCRTARA